jgi:hypothetical protein
MVPDDRRRDILDPVHGFVRIASDERHILDSWPLQRLRHVNQLATTYLIFPGATHKRFEHSIGVLELASRMYDVVTASGNSACTDLMPATSKEIAYWRKVVRIAGLLHDTGHLPFSHGAERTLLPEGITHESLTLQVIRDLQNCLPVAAEDVAKVAVGPSKYPGNLDPWQTLMAEIIVGDALGCDRVDYLLRDSYHMGLTYGKFDHCKLIDEMKILPKPNGCSSVEPALGIGEAACPAAEGLQFAHYFMYQRVYFHPVRRAYDLILSDFLKEWLPGGKLPTDLASYLSITDDEVASALRRAATSPDIPGHRAGVQFRDRAHWRVLYSWNGAEAKRFEGDPVQRVYEACLEQFGPDHARLDCRYPERPTSSFPLLSRNGSVTSASEVSRVLALMPAAEFGYVFVSAEKAAAAQRWFAEHRTVILDRNGRGCT